MKMVKPTLFGIAAGFGLLSLYFVTMSVLSKSFTVAWDQFRNLWYLMVAISATFGIQISFYTRMRSGRGLVSASGGTGALGMLACCAHHATDFLPFLGLSVVSLFLSRYQIPILVGSLIINLIGIKILWSKAVKPSC